MKLNQVPEIGWVFCSTLLAWTISRKVLTERFQRFKAVLSYALWGGGAIILGLFVAALVHPIQIPVQVGENVAYTFWAWVISRLFPVSVQRLKDFVSHVFVGEFVFIGLIGAAAGIEFAVLWLTGA